ncbi:hypothetical protein [Actinoplanes rectilineatus]|uniref:hypothetical protein n=1 Tax=Actinoplanes rectilineatus TaxID=113571 RepID=UPI0005F2ECD9|nr:hypothetical protein [Actinoplanes rectilineatus]
MPAANGWVGTNAHRDGSGQSLDVGTSSAPCDWLSTAAGEATGGGSLSCAGVFTFAEQMARLRERHAREPSLIDRFDRARLD